MSRKILVLAGIALVLTVIAVFLYIQTDITREDPLYVDGIYRGTATGYGGEIDLEVSVDRGHILRITIIDHNEDEEIAEPAFEQLERRIVENRGTEGVEAVSGATETSDAVIEAVNKALEGAKLE